ECVLRSRAAMGDEPAARKQAGRDQICLCSGATEKVTSLAEVVASPPNSAESDLSWAEQAVARIYSNFVRNGELTANSQFSTSSNRSTLLSIDEFSARFRKRQTLPDQIYADNIYMHPARIEDL